MREFTIATRRVDTDLDEAARIRALAESVDAEIVAYDQGLAALDRGDTDAAEALLLQAVTAELGHTDGILAELLTQAPSSTAPLSLRQRAAEARAHRTILNTAYKRHDSRPNPGHGFLHRLTSILGGEHSVTAEDLTEVLMTAMELADAFDAMTTTRHHRHRRSVQEALAEIRRCAGSHLDPEMVDAFLTVIDTKACQVDEIIGPDPATDGERGAEGTSTSRQKPMRTPVRGQDR